MSESYVTEIAHRLYICAALTVLAALPPTLAYFGFFKPSEETLASWFQRSGSITVILALWVEFLLIRIQKYHVLTGDLIVDEPEPEHKLIPLYTTILYAAGLFAIVGTVIWGYGDIMMGRT